MRLFLGLLILTGCAAQAYDSPAPKHSPPPQEMVDRVLSEAVGVQQSEPTPAPAAKEVIQSTSVDEGTPPMGPAFGLSDETLSALGDAVEAAAVRADEPSQEAGPNVRVIHCEASWCVPCKREAKSIPDVEKATGLKVETLDIANAERAKELGVDLKQVKKIPLWIIKAEWPDEAREQHVVGAGGHRKVPGLVAAYQAEKKPVEKVTYGLSGPTLKASDLTPFVAGKTLSLGDKASITIPANLKWTVAQKPGSVTLSFVNRPEITVKKFITWHIQLTGLEITPTAITLQTDSLLGNITAAVDWSSPK